MAAKITFCTSWSKLANSSEVLRQLASTNVITRQNGAAAAVSLYKVVAKQYMTN
jgi:hypothetical protein